MSNSDALYREVVAHPHNDAPRLVYADYLDDHGDPHGEFIRLQCELAKMSPFEDRWSELVARERRLLYEHGKTWSEPLSHMLARGFVAGLNQYNPAYIEEWGPDVFAQHPVELVWFYYQEEPGWGASFAHCDFLKNLRTIWIGGRSAYVESLDVLDMLCSPHLANLETFCITGDSMEGLSELTFLEWLNPDGALPPGLQNLRALSVNLWLPQVVINDSVLMTLLDSDLGSTLSCLSLDGHDSITEEGWEQLAASRLWEDLRELDLGLIRRGASELAAHWPRSKLQRLRVEPVGEQFRRLFLESPTWGELTHLDLCETTIQLGDFQAFVEHGAFGRLLELHMQNGRLSDEHFGLLANAPRSSGLRALHLRQFYDGDDGLIALSQSPYCRQLCELSINNVTPDGIDALVHSENFAHLHTLSIQADELGYCLEALAEATNLPNLTNLSAYPTTTNLGEEAIPKLLASPHRQRLSYLDIFQPQSPECHTALLDAENVVWLGRHASGAASQLARKCQLLTDYLTPATPPFFSWKPPI